MRAGLANRLRKDAIRDVLALKLCEDSDLMYTEK